MNKERSYGMQPTKLIDVLRKLTTPRCINSLADSCDISQRTAYRYIKVLRDNEVPLKYDDGKYFIPPTTTIKDL